MTPEEIIDLILSEMHAEITPSRYSIFVRSVFQVFLYGEELERLRPTLKKTGEEAIRALNEELDKLNNPLQKRLKIPLGSKRKHQALSEWTVEFHENTDDDAADNPLVIHSSFGRPTADPDRGGTETTRIIKRNSEGASTSTSRTITAPRRDEKRSCYAVFDYEDDSGPHTFEMTSELVKVGRGGEHNWVDIRLVAPRDVSREHFQVRRDAASGKFFLKDISTLGTTVNGRKVKASIEVVDGAEVDNNIEEPLPDKAKIGLAGVVVMKFKVTK